MPGLLPDVDPDGLLEYSVVYTDRSLNHMSAKFQGAMRELSALVRQVYHADAVAFVPGSGSFGMEAVARQLATDRPVLVLRNGWFSYRWTQILEMGRIPAEETVLKARRAAAGPTAPFSPAPIDEVVAAIRAQRPAVVFAPHVETASGILLPDAYLRAVGAAVHEVGGLFVLDCIASGALWVDMAACEVDVLLSAPQKGWSSTPCGAIVALSERARRRVEETTSTSFVCDLKRWLQIMGAYEAGGHAYHATLPTDGLLQLRDTMRETVEAGLETLRDAQWTQGRRIRALLEARGFPSVAAEGWQSPGVVVSYTTDADVRSGKAFAALGLQTAAGVPLQCDEGADFSSFRLGLFGLEKLGNVERSVQAVAQALERLPR